MSRIIEQTFECWIDTKTNQMYDADTNPMLMRENHISHSQIALNAPEFKLYTCRVIIIEEAKR